MYGLGMRYLGMSLGNSVLLGFTSAFGALVPSIYYNFHPTEGKTTFNDLLHTSWGRIVLVGVVLCLIGIYICGRAGVLKEHELPEEKKKGVSKSSGRTIPIRGWQEWRRSAAAPRATPRLGRFPGSGTPTWAAISSTRTPASAGSRSTSATPRASRSPRT